MDGTDESVEVTTARLHAELVRATEVQHVVQALADASATVLRAVNETSVTLRRGRNATTVAATGDRARRCDEVEYAADAGPCLTAADTGTTVLIPDLAAEHRWPAWRDAALEAGFVCAGAFPVPVDADVSVAINVYSETPRWTADDVERIERLTADLGRVVGYSLRLTELSRRTADLQAALESRGVIDQAVGVVMAQNRCGADDALDLLRRASQTRNVKLRDLAREIVAQVGGEGRASAFVARSG